MYRYRKIHEYNGWVRVIQDADDGYGANVHRALTERVITKQQYRLECVLDMVLTDNQMQAISGGWSAFYREPERYKNTTVADMVKQYIEEV